MAYNDIGRLTSTDDTLNRLTAVNKPGTADDIIYTYDERGNRTDIDVGTGGGGGIVDNTDLTFNIADRLTRVDYEDNSYRIYTHDAGGNCTKEEFYSGQYLMSPVVIPVNTTLSSHSTSIPLSRLDRVCFQARLEPRNHPQIKRYYLGLL